MFMIMVEIISTSFRPQLIVSLHLLPVKQLLQLQCLCMAPLFQRNIEDISAISIKTWRNYNRMNVFSAMKNVSI